MILRFLPWLRRGAASNITTADSPSAPANAINTVSIQVNETSLQIPVSLHGPGEVRGIESTLVSRREPRPNATDHAPNYFAAIEWSDEDFPWRFTPTQATGTKSRLRPWICLVVIAKTDATRLMTIGNAPLPSMDFPLADLPNLDESHAWAHVQIVADPSESNATPSDAELRAYVDANPSRALSRLLCPRHLSPKTTYMACVVPTFEAGRLAGLGSSESVSELSPAWTQASEGQVRLPVYHHWSFTTGIAGDFEKLARQLKPVQELPSTVGTRELAIAGSLAAQLGEEARTTTMGGALRPLSAAAPKEPAWAVSSRTPIRALLNRVAEIEQGEHLESSEEGRPVVGPPLYGRWQSGQTQIAEDWQDGWFSELNTGIESRATAGLGVRIVQAIQEELVAEAWKMVGQIDQVNQLLGRAQMAQYLGQRIADKHLAPLPIGALLPVMAPAQHRTKLAAKSLRATFAEGPVSTAYASAAQRRLSRARSPLLRRWKKPSTSFSIERINAKPQRTGHRAAMVSGMVHLDAIKAIPKKTTKGVLPADLTINVVASALALSKRKPKPLIANTTATHKSASPVKKKSSPAKHTALTQDVIRKQTASLSVSAAAASNERFDLKVRDRYQAAFQTLVEKRRSIAKGEPLPSPADLPALQATLLQAIDPAHTIPARVLGRISGIEAFRAPGFESSLDPVVAKPALNIPLAPQLVADDPNWLLPGADGVPPNAVVLLESRPEFIEAFMAGANHEMHRELRWRRVPSDLTGTLLRQFWDVRGASTNYSEDQSTIAPIEDWPRANRLGENGTSSLGSRAVFLIRSELVRRFPDATLFLQKAVIRNGSRSPDPTTEPLPVAFRGMLADDSLYVGFDITIADLRAGEGWYFVIQERFGAPRFGLDAPSTSDFVGNDWTNLSWSHLKNGQPNQHVAIGEQSLSANGASWGRNAGHMAAISIRKPVRVAIHIDKLLPPSTP